MRALLLAVKLFAAVTLLFPNVLRAEDIARGVRVVVIDAGHGGAKFPGAHYWGVYEKDLNLKVALKLGRLIEKEMPEVKVVYTRTTDKQLGTTLNADLQARANIAHEAGGDLFISIHANAAPSASASGVETLVMGESPRETAANRNVLFANNKEEFMDMSNERTAAIVRAYIQNLQFTYGEYSMAMARCIQNNYVRIGRKSRGIKPQPLKVLYATDMPSVLTEIGFMSNAAEFAYMNSEKGQNELARALCNAVKEYAAYVKGTLLVEDEAPAEPEEEPAAAGPEPEKSPAPEPSQAEGAAEGSGDGALQPAAGKAAATSAKRTSGYAVQVLASASKVTVNAARFGRYAERVKCYTGSGKLPYKYCVGEHADRKSAQATVAEIRKSFPDAFVVHYEGGGIVP